MSVIGAVQGRIGAIDDSHYKDKEVLREDRLLMSTMLKTGVQYGLQPVTVPDATAQMLGIYYEHYRPRILQQPNDPLFISQTGSKLRMGRLLSAYFKRTLGLKISSTTIRSIVETEAEGLLLAGQISAAERASVLNINGHKGTTSFKFYQKRSLVEDVVAGVSVHKKLLRLDEESLNKERAENSLEISPDRMLLDFTDNSNTPIAAQSQTSAYKVVSEVGVLHPFINEVRARRVTWTDIEVNTVGTWIVNYLRLHPDCNCVISKCLSYILGDETLYRNFHPNHVLDSTRLRYGWEKYKEENNITDLY